MEGYIGLPQRIGQPECQFYLKTGTCKFGGQCKYHHPGQQLPCAGSTTEGALLWFNHLGLPIRLGEKECVYYLRTGRCKFGTSCKFHHPEPINIEAMFRSPIPLQCWATIRHVASVAGSGFYSGVSPPYDMQPPYASSSQSIPMTCWNSYQGQYVTSNDRQMKFMNSTQPKPGWTLSSDSKDLCLEYPQRPEQPDCDFYMKTGLCGFGGNCKYHHPKDITIPSLPTSMSPMGLPLRPGMQLCTFYLRNGICKFGPICKFDHPIAPLVSLFPSKEPSKAGVDPPFSPIPISVVSLLPP